ncbi:MAG TPA: hypothetical protein VH116_00550 [Gemmatimonadales bacterium]|nr:hypothetical protein [Gemmatimonadales bacterium]
MSGFWTTWRKEIVRGAVLFCAVLAGGYAVFHVVGHVHQAIADRIPAALRDLPANLDADLSEGPRTTGPVWTYRARLAPKQTVWIHDVNGSVRLTPSKRDSLEVRAVKTYHNSDPANVQLVTHPYDGGVAICAVWQADSAGASGAARCEPGEHGKARGSRRGSDVAVDFTVLVPRGVRVGVSTVNGSVHATDLTAPIDAVTVSGDVDAETASGPVRAGTVNGGVHVRILAFGDTGEVALFSVNGGVVAELPPQLDADVDATTVNGSIDTDYPLTVSGKFVGHSLRGTLGRGGRRVHLVTVNGGVALKHAHAGPFGPLGGPPHSAAPRGRGPGWPGAPRRPGASQTPPPDK